MRDYCAWTTKSRYEGKWALNRDQVNPTNQIWSVAQAKFDSAFGILYACESATDVYGRCGIIEVSAVDSKLD